MLAVEKTYDKVKMFFDTRPGQRFAAKAVATYLGLTRHQAQKAIQRLEDQNFVRRAMPDKSQGEKGSHYRFFKNTEVTT